MMKLVVRNFCVSVKANKMPKLNEKPMPRTEKFIVNFKIFEKQPTSEWLLSFEYNHT